MVLRVDDEDDARDLRVVVLPQPTRLLMSAELPWSVTARRADRAHIVRGELDLRLSVRALATARAHSQSRALRMLSGSDTSASEAGALGCRVGCSVARRSFLSMCKS